MKAVKEVVRKYYKYWTQPSNPTGITATSGWENPMNAFDNNPDTYARCNTLTDYIEYDLGEDIILTGIQSNGIQINGQAVATGLKIVSVNNNVERLIIETQPSTGFGAYTNNANISNFNTNKIRIYINITYSGAPSRTIQITFLGYKEATPSDYDFYEDIEVYKIPKEVIGEPQMWYAFDKTASGNVIVVYTKSWKRGEDKSVYNTNFQLIGTIPSSSDYRSDYSSTGDGSFDYAALEGGFVGGFHRNSSKDTFSTGEVYYAINQ